LQRRFNFACHHVGSVVVPAEKVVFIVILFGRPEIFVPERGPSNIGKEMFLCSQDIEEKGFYLDFYGRGIEMGDLVSRLPQPIIELRKVF